LFTDSVNQIDKDGSTVLHRAVQADAPGLVSCLLLSGADAALRNKLV
jgi:hypothetical protein